MYVHSNNHFIQIAWMCLMKLTRVSGFSQQQDNVLLLKIIKFYEFNFEIDQLFIKLHNISDTSCNFI